MSAAPNTAGWRRAPGRATVDGMSVFGKVRERRTRKGALRWYIDARPYGRIYARRDALGEQPFASREEAERFLERLRARIDDNLDAETVVAKLMPKSAVTVERRAQAWLDEQRSRAEQGQITLASVAVIESHITKHWGFWDGKPVMDVRMGEVADWQKQLAATLRPATVRSVLGYFYAFLRWLAAREEIDRIPARPPTTVPERTPKLMSRDAQNRVLEAIPEEDRGIYLACVDLALRPSEARALAFSDFELADGVPWVTIRRAFKGPLATDRVGGTKTGRVRVLPSSDRLWAWVQAHGARFGPTFLHDGKPWGRWLMNRYWQSACGRAGVAVGPVRESTRHSTATEMAFSNDLDLTRKLLGHRDTATTERYAKLRPASLVPLVRSTR